MVTKAVSQWYMIGTGSLSNYAAIIQSFAVSIAPAKNTSGNCGRWVATFHESESSEG
jgi:hypothetical protein